MLSAVPTFLASDVAATVSWYADNLGFVLAGHFPDTQPYAYASLQRDGAEIMLLSLEGYSKPDIRHLRPVGFWDAYIRTDGVAALYETVRGQPFVVMELTKQNYGDTEFEVLDPNGYTIVFGGAA
jgi:catechol 2,3-dioxygenase-like lactoylglutathione lyase family enzyme